MAFLGVTENSEKLFFINQWETSEPPRSHKDNIREELCVKRRELNFNYFYLSKVRQKTKNFSLFAFK